MVSGEIFAVCRLCLHESQHFAKIFEGNVNPGYVISEVIADLIRHPVLCNDGYPQCVCTHCLVKLTKYTKFKKMCLESKAACEELLALTMLHKPGQHVEVMPQPPPKIVPSSQVESSRVELPSTTSNEEVETQVPMIIIKTEPVDTAYEEEEEVQVDCHPDCLLKETDNLDESCDQIEPHADSLVGGEMITDDFPNQIEDVPIKSEPAEEEHEEEDECAPVPVKLVHALTGKEVHSNVDQGSEMWEGNRTNLGLEENEIIIKEEAEDNDSSSCDGAGTSYDYCYQAGAQMFDVSMGYLKHEMCTGCCVIPARERQKRKRPKKKKKTATTTTPSKPKIKIRRNQMRECRERGNKKGRKRGNNNKQQVDPKPPVNPRRFKPICTNDLRCAYRERCISDRKSPLVKPKKEVGDGTPKPVRVRKPVDQAAVSLKLHLQRERMRKLRASLTPEQLTKRRTLDRERKAISRQNESPEEREKKLRLFAQRARIRRLREMAEQKAERLRKDQLRRAMRNR